MYEFTEDCLVHIEQLDDEHRRLFQMLNEAISMAESAADVSGIAKELLRNLKEYAAVHFAHEEAYMEEIQDSELPRQRAEHLQFTKKMSQFSCDTSSPEAARASLQELLTYLVRWLYRHILSSDMMIGKIAAAESDSFAFTERYRTGIELIDDEHRRLFEIIREVNELINAELLHDKYDEIMRLLEELKNYTEFHFSDEEKLMESIGYPGLDAQRRAHAAFVERLVEIDLSDLDAMDNNQQEYLNDLIRFLLGWLSTHILGTDRKIGDYIRENEGDTEIYFNRPDGGYELVLVRNTDIGEWKSPAG